MGVFQSIHLKSGHKIHLPSFAFGGPSPINIPFPQLAWFSISGIKEIYILNPTTFEAIMISAGNQYLVTNDKNNIEPDLFISSFVEREHSPHLRNLCLFAGGHFINIYFPFSFPLLSIFISHFYFPFYQYLFPGQEISKILEMPIHLTRKSRFL